jgi:hypothetical protein
MEETTLETDVDGRIVLTWTLKELGARVAQDMVQLKVL